MEVEVNGGVRGGRVLLWLFCFSPSVFGRTPRSLVAIHMARPPLFFLLLPPPRCVFRDQMWYVVRFTRRRRAKGARHHPGKKRDRQSTVVPPVSRPSSAPRPTHHTTTGRDDPPPDDDDDGAALSPRHPRFSTTPMLRLPFFLSSAPPSRPEGRFAGAARFGAAHRRRPRTRCGVCAPEGLGGSWEEDGGAGSWALVGGADDRPPTTSPETSLWVGWALYSSRQRATTEIDVTTHVVVVVPSNSEAYDLAYVASCVRSRPLNRREGHRRRRRRLLLVSSCPRALVSSWSRAVLACAVARVRISRHSTHR